MKCIQCGTLGCGVDLCRFSGMPHAEYLRIQRVVNNYANAMSDRDRSARHEGRPDHDTSCSGLPLKAGT
jgi:hypothetical protein